MEQVPLLVLGAGVDGMLTALALAHQGFPVRLLDRDPEPDDDADGFPPTTTALLPPYANHELAGLGLLDALVPAITEPQGLVHADAQSGRPLRRIALGPAVRTRWRDPLLAVAVAEMRRLLAAVCAADDMVTVEYGVRPTVVDDVVEGALVGDETGPSYRAEALIAADGVDSPVRSLVRGGHAIPPPYLVHRGRWPEDVPRDEIRMWSSPLLHLTCTPTPGSGVADLEMIVRGDVGLAELQRTGAYHAAELRTAVDAALATPPVRVHHHRPLERWTRHRIAVLGAAAQPLLPHEGQALAQSVLDAAALGAAFDRWDGRVVAAFEHYERARAIPRARAAGRALDVAGVLHADGLVRQLRDCAWAGTSPDPQASVVSEG